MAKFNIDYDNESDDLFLFSSQKSKGSVEIGDLVLDFNKEGKLVGLEFLNATTFLKSAVGREANGLITGDFLSHLIKCDVETKQQNNFLFIKITIVGKNATVSLPINAPLIEKTSPALAYA